MTAAAVLAAVTAAGALVGAAPVKVTVTAPGHTPKVGSRWNYTVRATSAGRPVAGTISETIVDPIGGSHPVQLGKTTRKITNLRFRGVFRDFVIWPATSRGIPLKLRVVVVVGKTRRVVEYAVTPRG